MKLAIVTGVSKGLGKKIAIRLMADGVAVIGVSRSDEVDLHETAKQMDVLYEHVAVDLTKEMAVLKVVAAAQAIVSQHDVTRLYIVNNAAMLEPVDFAYRIDVADVKDHYMINVFAPIELMGAIIRFADEIALPVCIGNVTSGAATNAIPGWSAYSSGKAAINMYTASLAAELHLANKPHEVFAFSPGVMDTNMQAEIRAANEEQFPNVSMFQGYKESGRLIQPEVVADVLVDIMMGVKGPVRLGHVYQITDYI